MNSKPLIYSISISTICLILYFLVISLMAIPYGTFSFSVFMIFSVHIVCGLYLLIGDYLKFLQIKRINKVYGVMREKYSDFPVSHQAIDDPKIEKLFYGDRIIDYFRNLNPDSSMEDISEQYCVLGGRPKDIYMELLVIFDVEKYNKITMLDFTLLKNNEVV